MFDVHAVWYHPQGFMEFVVGMWNYCKRVVSESPWSLPCRHALQR